MNDSPDPVASEEEAPGETRELAANQGPEGEGPVEELQERQEPPMPPAEPEEVAASATEFLVGLFDALGLPASVEAATEGDRAILNVSGDELGALIGRRGQTLDALQELTRTAVQRRLKARSRLLVDVEGYRSRRRASLAEYARAMAARAQERGTEIELEPMNAYERKIVHDAVADIAGASSFSEGEEPQRKVIVRGE